MRRRGAGRPSRRPVPSFGADRWAQPLAPRAVCWQHAAPKEAITVFLLTRGLPVLLELGLTIFCLIDCVQTPEAAIRNLPKWGWIVLILFFPLVGSIAWLVAGRPLRAGTQREYVTGYPEHQRQRPVLGPDDDPEYLRQLGRIDDEHEQMLRQWESDLRRREKELRRDDEQPPGDGTASPG